ncbi:unnamed protein product [Knipowitschia caucasica]|uniref:Interleukin-4 n=1 Tax=Knipowitschia caucasica TaxID=637954 RepID=A0AAV2MJ13_KNICA
MEKKLIYTLRLIMFCTILYAVHIPPSQLHLLRKIEETVDNLSAQSLVGSVTTKRSRRVCAANFFCLAEKSLSAVHIPQLGKLCSLLDRYNNQTGQTTCELKDGYSISIQEMLGKIRNCTVKALNNHTQESPRVQPSLRTSLSNN